MVTLRVRRLRSERDPRQQPARLTLITKPTTTLASSSMSTQQQQNNSKDVSKRAPRGANSDARSKQTVNRDSSLSMQFANSM